MKLFTAANTKLFVSSSILIMTTSCGLLSSSKNNHSDDPSVDISIDIEQLRQSKPLGLTGSLQSFANCDEALSHLKAGLAQELTTHIIKQMIWVNESNPDYRDVVFSTPSANPEETQDSAGSSAPSNHSETNNQVAGVEEADIVKTDGTHIYQIARGRLRILKSWPANQLTEIHEMDLNLRPIELFLDKDRKKIVVIGNEIGKKKVADDTLVADSAKSEDMSTSFYGNINFSTIIVSTIDVTTPSKPILQSRHSFKGTYNNSRRIDGAVRLIIQNHSKFPQGVKTHLPLELSQGKSKKEQIESLRALLIAGHEKIMTQDLNFFLDLDSFTREKGGVISSSLNIGNCENIHAPTVSSPNGFTNVLTLNLDSEEITSTSLLTYVDMIYASEKSLYLAAQYYWHLPILADGNYTFIHKFDISNPESTDYIGSGQVEGYLLNQFAMDEYENNLRVAVTVPTSGPSINRISVMSIDEGVLNIVGNTPDLAKDERIYSVRFAEKKGYIVTFRQIDPLFTLDLSEPTDPKVVGELKIPGYSSYLHMLDDNHLLAVGRAGTDDGRILGLKLSIFDVSDMANPKESHSFTTDNNAWSEAEWNHKAFTFFPAKKLLGIPVSGYSYTASNHRPKYFSKIAIFNIDSIEGISEKGSLSMDDIFAGVEESNHWWNDGATVRRSIFADDYIYAISDLGVKAANIEDLANPVGTVRYKCDQLCFERWSWW